MDQSSKSCTISDAKLAVNVQVEEVEGPAEADVQVADVEEPG